jgi:hypothetical protein
VRVQLTFRDRNTTKRKVHHVLLELDRPIEVDTGAFPLGNRMLCDVIRDERGKPLLARDIGFYECQLQMRRVSRVSSVSGVMHTPTPHTRSHDANFVWKLSPKKCLETRTARKRWLCGGAVLASVNVSFPNANHASLSTGIGKPRVRLR